MQNEHVRKNDYWLVPLFRGQELRADDFEAHVARGKQLSLALLYWLQTDCPRPDGGTGWPGLRLRPDLLGTEDGLAKYPYIRESRRIAAEFTVVEQHVGTEVRRAATGRGDGDVEAEPFPDSVGADALRGTPVLDWGAPEFEANDGPADAGYPRAGWRIEGPRRGRIRPHLGGSAGVLAATG